MENVFGLYSFKVDDNSLSNFSFAKSEFRKVTKLHKNFFAFVGEDYAKEIIGMNIIEGERERWCPEWALEEGDKYLGLIYGVEVYFKKGTPNNIIEVSSSDYKKHLIEVGIKDYIESLAEESIVITDMMRK